MKKKVKSKFRNRPQRRLRKSGNKIASKAAPAAIFIICLLGCLWVWKENWNERLSTELLGLESRNRQLKEQRDILRASLADLSQFARIECLARTELGMITPRVPPDTIWCETVQQKPVLGAMIFYDFSCQGK